MKTSNLSPRKVQRWRVIPALFCVILAAGCYRPMTEYDPWRPPHGGTLPTDGSLVPTQPQAAVTLQPTAFPRITFTPAPSGPRPTQDQPRVVPTLRSEETLYVVEAGDSLAKIALLHQVSVRQIVENNEIEDPNLIEPGQQLRIPPASANELATAFKIIPESELVYSPSAKDFDTALVISQFNSKLSGYSEELEDGTELTGAQIVQRVADENSVNPRLLLVLLEYRSQWLTSPAVNGSDDTYPLGNINVNYKGLYKQLSWAANEMLRGSNLWAQGSLAVWTLADGTVLRIDNTINPATAGLQFLFSLLFDIDEWNLAVSEGGIYGTYERLFGYPFAFSIDPLLPDDLVQPEFILPLAPGDTWLFTSGPHWGWGTGSIWAALDFAPPGEVDDYGCYESDAPVLAVADGYVVRSGNAQVILDLDGDHNEQTGWTVTYMHIASEGRVEEGTQIATGDVIGYASCEGGITTGTHFHIARRYNGVWIGAGGNIPFNLGGWVASSLGTVYDGYLTKNGETVEAYNGRADLNEIGN